MICSGCRRQVSRRDAACPSCGRPVRGGVSFEVVLPDGARVPLTGVVTIGRAAESTIQLTSRSVSRRHARVLAAGDAPVVEDLGSSYGTFVNDVRAAPRAALTDGSRLRLGDVDLRVERRREESEAGRTIAVPAAGTVMISAAGVSEVQAPGEKAPFRPRARSGWSLKRMDASEGELRWVLRSERDGAMMRVADGEAALFRMLDGSNALPDLMAAAEREIGEGGVARLARLLADLAQRGFLSGIEAEQEAPASGLARLVQPRLVSARGIDGLFEGLYRRGGFLLFTTPALVLVAVAAVAGLAAYVDLLIGRGGTPFVVGSRVGLGAVVFVLGRLALVLLHELAHGLTMASYDRRVPRAGVKMIIGIPFAFVDTTEAWFEPRRRRLVVSAAGPVSDLALAGGFSIFALLVGPGTLRDVLFQLAFAGYVGALFNLNPFLDRDGYHMMVDLLGVPGLRKRARAHLARRLAGRPTDPRDGRAVAIYAVASVAWLLLAAGFVIFLTLRYHDALVALAPAAVVWTVLGALYVLLFVPVLLVVGRPLLERLRGGARPADAPA